MTSGKQLRQVVSFGEFFRLFFNVIRTMRRIKSVPAADRIPPPLSEKIMLTVSGVNECAYCSYLHTQTALEKGVGRDEINRLLAGVWDHLPAEEMPAVLYAQHYADSGGKVSAEARQKVLDYYGKMKTRHIEGYLAAVYFGNICANTVYAADNKLAYRRRGLCALMVYLLCKPIAVMIKHQRREGERDSR